MISVGSLPLDKKNSYQNLTILQGLRITPMK